MERVDESFPAFHPSAHLDALHAAFERKQVALRPVTRTKTSAALVGKGVAGPVSKPLTSDEVLRISGPASVYRYPELAGVPDWNALMSKNNAALILFLTDSPTDGHWICAFEGADKKPHFFDPIGMALDTEQSVIGAGMAGELGEGVPQLTRLLRSSGQTPVVSRVDFQKNAPGINTCGRWTGLRLRNKNMSDPEFTAFVKDGVSKSGLDPDSWVDSVTGGSAAGGSLLGGGKWTSHMKAQPTKELKLFVARTPLETTTGGLRLPAGTAVRILDSRTDASGHQVYFVATSDGKTGAYATADQLESLVKPVE